MIDRLSFRSIIILFVALSVLSFACDKKYIDERFGFPNGIENIHVNKKDTDSTIFVRDNIVIKDKGRATGSLYSYAAFENFLIDLLKTGRFIFVPLNELKSTNCNDKVIIALRHDVDYDIASSMRFARREYELGIRGTYYILHTADYYSRMADDFNIYYKDPNRKIVRKPYVLDYIKKIQNEYHHEIGWHNDLVTLQVHYNINSGEYLKKELDWLRSNGIKITGTSSHGSKYCYIYRYINAFFWEEFKDYSASGFFNSFEYVRKGNEIIKIDKYKLSDFQLDYEAELLRRSLFYADVGKKWHMNMIDWNSLKPGSKIIILFHPALWDSY